MSAAQVSPYRGSGIHFLINFVQLKTTGQETTRQWPADQIQNDANPQQC